MNVSELSDVELNRAMIWCYPTNGEYWQDPDTGTHYRYYQFELEQMHYLDDYNLTMPLAVEHKIAVLPCMTGRHLATRYAGTENVEAANKNPLRAIAEVLIMIAMEKKG